jgi:hypothetical protein
MVFRAGFYGLLLGVVVLTTSGFGLLDQLGKPGVNWGAVSAAPLAADNGSGDNGSGDNGSADNGSTDNGNADNGAGDNGAVVVSTQPTSTPTPVPAPAAAPAPAPAPPQPVAQPCFFTQGFAFLRNQIIQTEGSDVIGPCLENEHGNLDPATLQLVNKDTLQQATNGLYVWQEFTNTMRTTNGFSTWTYSKCGLQKRLNTQTFAWEQNPSLMAGPSPAPPAGACDVA